MSVQFDIAGMEWPPDSCGCSEPPAHMFLQLANVNAMDFLRWIGLEHEKLYGQIAARHLAALLRRRLWPARRGQDDDGFPAFHIQEPGQVTVICAGRPAGRLAEYAVRLLALAEFAGDGVVTWD